MDGPHERARLLIQEYLKESLGRISFWQGYSFAQTSYAKWAATELLKCLDEKQTTPPLIVIEEFRDKMNRFSCMNRNTSYVFSVAYDMAGDIIDQLLT